MKQTKCRLSVADKCFLGGGLGGGSTEIDMRNPGAEKQDIKGYYNLQQKQLDKYVRKSPLLSRAETGATGFYDQMFGPGSATMTGYEKFIAPKLESGGALTPEQERDVAQQTRAGFAARGNVMGNQALGAELLNRDKYQRERFNEALGQVGTVQGLQTGGLNQLLGVESGEVGNFTTLQNPMLSYLSNLFGGNLQASTAQAGINQQGNIAGANKTSDIIGGVLQSIGSVAGAAAASDERLKRKIRETGLKTRKDVPIKTFEYRTRPGARFIGVTAQDVAKHDPGAVFTDPVSGVKSVGAKYVPVLLTRMEEIVERTPSPN
jgi:hypothetical protein